ncbi:MAG: CvpA family protein [Dysgonamonadaceae bacterium]|jgi:membrane protein required for colicin V production|nr:CvpA family protein [Dysgonamonadaceae bacterium]
MNWLDITIVILLLLAFINGYRKGLVMQLIGLAGILLAVIFGGKFANIISPHLDRVFELSPQVLHVLSYVIAFVAILLVASLVGQIIERIVDIIFLDFFNRLFGGIVGIAATVVILSLLLNLLLAFDKDERIISARIKSNSFFFERIEPVVPAIVPYLNKELWNEYIPERYNSKSDSLYYQTI